MNHFVRRVGAGSAPALRPELLDSLDAELQTYDSVYTARYPGPPGPGPVHTVYVPVPAFDADVVTRWGHDALAAVDANATQWESVLAEMLDNDQAAVLQLAQRTAAKLATEAIEDLRIDFEDGFRGHRGTAEDDRDEDEHALRAAGEMAGLLSVPRSWGVRIRSLAPETRRRGLRTLDLFVAELLNQMASIPAGFVITLPKVTGLQQVSAFVRVLSALEEAHRLPAGSLRFEIQVETPQTLVGADGRIPLAEMIHGGDGRVSGLHFGTYDYTASLGILGTHQDLRHPVADLAKGLMMLVAAETGVRVSDGSDNRIPVGDPQTVRQRWARHADGVLRALRGGIYQGWDLHPAQLPTRFAATFAFFRNGWSEAAERLGNYHRQASSGVMDEPATAFALARHLAAARACGAVDAGELAAVAGIGDDVVSRYLVRGAVPGGAS